MGTGTIFRIARYAVHDGPGIRTTVFFKGCPLRCTWCHSPESQARAPELLVHPERCSRCGTCLRVCPNHAVEDVDGRFVPVTGCRACGTCVDTCPEGARQVCGRAMTVSDVVAAVEKDRLFYDESGGGVTFSGGEPLLQPEFLVALLRACRSRGIHTAVDTTGYASTRVLDDVRAESDLILYDVKLLDDARHREATGVSNRVILANLRRLAASGGPLRVRVPLVPGVNDDLTNVRATGEFLRRIGIGEIDLLPYHRAGIAKYARLRRPYPLADTPEPTVEEIDRVRTALANTGVATHLGG